MEVAKKRRQSEGGIYHVFSRGVGRQIIFEDDKDRNTFLKISGKVVRDHQVEILAWCLMDNHFHFLLRGNLDEIGKFMRMLLSPYASYFNREHGREGHVFQGRYGSEPIDRDSYLLHAVRYIHQNPEKAYIAPTDRYRWSSYQEYVHSARITSTAPVLELFGTVGAFIDFHRLDSSFSLREYNDGKEAAAIKRAMRTAIDELGEDTLHRVRALSRPERASAIRRLASRGLTIRQIERLTGVSRSTIARLLG